ncbi:polysaccharide biosynthesis protein [Pseudoflavonifractor phocaeensis]|uniref:polysaccharide biosynthesis protein n=1 Tax=Pseudoflavonifractor phocaeensis TaxID=1870988 RepID=UPI001F388356|nr:nucleoside-diphosphate sugar epimerase/dehydratase [Pseudoflavonifractor phocaeensis]MCF2595537.1 polysaccharide biosynthesis protein [Pseudoflavonifractor phocaeensis]
MSRFRKPLLFFCDSLILLGVTLTLSKFSLRYGLPDAVGRGLLLKHLLVLYACTAVFQLLFHTYDSLWRYAESREYLSLLTAAFCGFLAYEVISRALMDSVISFILLVAIACLWVLGMLLVRFSYRVYRSRVLFRRGGPRVPVAIIGAGAAGVQLLEELQSNPDSHYTVQCFFDDDPAKVHNRIHGVEVKGRIADIPDRLRAMDIRELLVAIPSISEDRRHEILQELSGLERVRVTILPSTLDLIAQKPIRSQLREIRIEDLLGREPVRLDPAPVDDFLGGKTVLVTGGGGSIGSELCRQIAKHHPKRLIIVDIYENNAYDIQQELLYHFGKRLNLVVEIASVRDGERLRQLFAMYRPDVVFHAAAHKHVPLMEQSPQEAVRNNVFGTLNLVRTADEYGVEKFIQISTDKAVNPTSVMGATKRLCEMILQSMKGQSGTTFAAVRFGNVLGSNGSVVPLFKRQIAAGGPITVTDKRIIRYFMTIPEAAQLVLQAGAMARQNELYVLDMGQPVKILDLAENLIRLSGYVPYRDIDIVETGLRPGEKLYEELLIASRDIEKTENDQIFVERQPGITPEELRGKLAVLSAALEKNDPTVIRDALHQVVPTFHEPEDLNRDQGDEVRIPEPNVEEKENSVVCGSATR